MIVEPLGCQLEFKDSFCATTFTFRYTSGLVLISGPERVNNTLLLWRIPENLIWVRCSDNLKKFVIVTDCGVVSMVLADEFFKVLCF